MLSLTAICETYPHVDGQAVVYFLTTGRGTKIGWTDNAAARFHGAQTDNEFRLADIWMHPCHEANQCEIALHEYFRDKWIRGEWFNLDHDDFEKVSREFQQPVDISLFVRVGLENFAEAPNPQSETSRLRAAGKIHSLSSDDALRLRGGGTRGRKRHSTGLPVRGQQDLRTWGERSQAGRRQNEKRKREAAEVVAELPANALTTVEEAILVLETRDRRQSRESSTPDVGRLAQDSRTREINNKAREKAVLDLSRVRKHFQSITLDDLIFAHDYLAAIKYQARRMRVSSKELRESFSSAAEMKHQTRICALLGLRDIEDSETDVRGERFVENNEELVAECQFWRQARGVTPSTSTVASFAVRRELREATGYVFIKTKHTTKRQPERPSILMYIGSAQMQSSWSLRLDLTFSPMCNSLSRSLGSSEYEEEAFDLKLK